MAVAEIVSVGGIVDVIWDEVRAVVGCCDIRRRRVIDGGRWDIMGRCCRSCNYFGMV